MDPFTGQWIANLSKSERHANHQFQSATLRFEMVGDDVSLTQSGVNMSGKHESSTLSLRADGKEHPVHPQAPDVVVVTTRVSPHLLDTVARKQGAVLGHGTYEVSPDGSTLTAKVAGIDALGAVFQQVIVFDQG